jgi:2,3-bisphosphoglycerate-independent phosphoglycerate mutase
VVRRVLVVLDGAPEPPADGPTSLEAAVTPALDALCARGVVGRLRTTPAGLAPGSETGLPTLLGTPPAAPVARGPIEAAAAGVRVPPGQRAWRLDLRGPDGRRATGREVSVLLPVLRAHLPGHAVLALRGHRVLALGARRPAVCRCAGLHVAVWPDGAELAPVLDERTTLVCGPGAAAGVGRLLGARVAVPAGATGDVDTDLDAKALAAAAALRAGQDVVVHVGGPDEAAHRGDPAGKRAALERIDGRLVAPLAAVARDEGALLAVTADHGTCPRTGAHDAQPVPVVVAGPGVPAVGGRRLCERAVERLPVEESPWALARGVAVPA